jgi:hypothetical protein
MVGRTRQEAAMPTIAYQSFNANSSSTHGLDSIAKQRFTKDTNSYVTSQGHQALVLPSDPGNLTAPLEGPAELKPIELLVDKQTVGTFGTHISLAYQNFYRALQSMPDIMVIGELDTSHADFSSMIGGTDTSLTAHPSKKACQSFTAISQTQVASCLTFLKSGEGFVVYAVGDLTVVFVHVPNRIATSSSETQQFYYNIAHSLAAKSKQIDLIIGDTNQPRFNFSAEVLNIAFGTKAYINASSTASIVKYDNWQVEEKGTNSTGTKMYDVAVYRSDVNDVKAGPVYISQSSGGITVTDHCGVGLTIERKKTG